MRTLRSACAVLATAFACAIGAAPALADTVVIDAVDSPAAVFQPANVTIDIGDTVRWEFDAAATTHNVTNVSTNWTIAESRGPNGDPVTRTFNTAGTYTFVCTVHNGMTGSVTVEAPALDRVLVFSKTGGFRHDSIPQGIAAIQALGTANDFDVVATEDAAQFTDANLATFDVVVFLSTTGEVLNDTQQAAFERYIQAGGGFAGVHAASDTEYSWPWFGELVGGYFRSHPPGTPSAAVDIEDGDEPSTTGLPTRWTRTDEWYNYQHPTTPVVNGNTTVADFSPRARHVKVLATVDESTYDEQDGNTVDDDHPVAWCSDFDGGRSWYTAMGHTQASFSEANFRSHLLGGLRTAAGVAGDCGDERDMPPTAADFEKVTLNDNTNAPMEIDVAEDGRAFYVELDGRVMMWSPGTQTTTQLIHLSVTMSHENGLLGIQLAPDFETTNHIYLAYSANPDSTNTNRVSRFTLSGNTLTDERIVYTWQHQRQECCHTGGSLDFGPDGNLYISTGDNTNPFAHGFNPTDERPGRQNWDAQRTSANTNNPNGKILRIRPVANPTGPGVGTGYTIPAGNLYPVGTALTLPEIYAMGFRNPFRIHVDQKTGWVLMGDYGPDAGSTDPNRGPQGSVEYNVVKQPGFYGWPYCVRENVPYKNITYTTNAGGTVNGDYSCSAPVNDSPNNTGLTNLPAAIPATMWMGYSELDNRFPDLGGGGAPTGGARYYYDEDNPSPNKFPKFYDGQWFIGEWNNDWIKTTTLNNQGLATGVACFAICQGYISPMDVEFGPNGSMYVVEWGQGFNENNPDSGVYRVDYISGARSPIANATVNNDAVPVGTTVNFSSTGSNDPDGTPISYLWDFDDGTPTSTQANPSHTFTAAGTYDVTLTVTDGSGDTAVDTVRVVVGNQRPIITFEYPETGKVADFGDRIRYKLGVVDPDGGTVPCNQVRLEFKLGHDSHAHELSNATGCEGEFTLTGVDGHGVDANIFTVITANYTDQGNGPAAPVTGSAEVILQPKLKQAEYFATTGRAADGRGTGDPGVTTEATTDVGGGLSAAFIEDGDWISFNPYNLEDLSKATFRVASGGAGGIIELRYDAADGPLVAATPNIAPTGGWQSWRDVTIDLPATIPQGTHRLFVVFRHPTATGSLMNLNYFKFTGKGAAVTAPPEVTATAEPLTGEAPLNVAFNATATDAENEALTYAWDFGVPGTGDDTSTQEDPNYTYTAPGNYTATVTVTDASGGKSSATVEVRVTRPLDECPTGPVRSDEFDGSALDLERWTVLRPDEVNPFTVSDGNLNLPIANGSMYGPGTSAKNLIVQPTPEGEWMATAKISVTALNENYQQAGLRVWTDDNNWASVHMISAGGNRDFEFIYENAGNPRNEGQDKLGGIPADSPLTYYVRIVSDGESLNAFYSYDGVQFLPVGRPAPLSTFGDEPQIGPAALSDLAPSVPMSRFDWIRFDPDGTGGGNEGVVDEFEGTTLGGDWDRIRGDQSSVVSGGTLQIPAQTGDIYQTRNDAKNLTVRTAPSGAWEAVAKLNFEGTAQYHQAGIMIYGDDNNFTKFGRIAHSAAGDEKFEFIYENNAVARNEAADSTANIPADFPDDFWVRLTSDGTNVVGHYSTNGSTWTPVGRPAPLPADAKIGLFAFSNDGVGNPVAAFDSFTLTGDEVGGGGGGGGTPSGPSYDDQFDDATLDKTRWNAIVRDTPAQYNLAGGEFNLTLSQGDIYTGDTNPPPNNFILQDASHAGADWVIETKINDYTHDGGYAQGGLMAYVDGDNYIKFDVITDPNNTRANRIELRSEIAGVIQEPQSNATLTAAQANGPFWLRLTKEGSTYRGEYSFDGVAWTATPNSPVTNPMAAPDFGIFGFSPQEAGVGDTVSFDYFQLDGPDPSQCEQCDGPGDTFTGDALDADRWNAIAHDDPTKYAVSNGNLVVTTTAGEIYQGSTGGGPLILQAADHAGTDFVLETKLTNTLDGGYSQGGIMVYGSDNDYVKLNAISDDGQGRVNRLELRSEVGGVVSATPTDPQITAAQAPGPLWLRLTKAGNSYTAEYKTTEDGAWTAFSGPVTNAMVAPRFGLYTQGVLQSGDTVTFEYFAVDGDSTGCPPVDENNAPDIESATATPASGFAPLPVQFAVTASDEDDDDLTYAWDFDGNGSTDSTSEDPSHTYTTAGTFNAKVTVSDGEDDTSRTIPVSVFGADDPEARFRVLVFSKTTGFRHDSIDEGIAAVQALGAANDFQVDASEDATLFRDNVLSRYDAVVFMSTTGDPLNADQQAAFERYIRAGGGYAGVHAAADTEYEWTWYGKLVGGYFRNHPPGTPTATVRVEDTDHHSTTGLPNPWERVDEWYNYQQPEGAVVGGGGTDWSPRLGGVHVLATVDESTYDEQDGNATDDDHPISWCQRYDGGRSWYTGMGHTAASFSEANFVKHLLGGIEVAAGAVNDADCGDQGGNQAPTVTAQRNPSGDVSPGDPVAFTATGTDPDGDTLTYEWDFGDGGTATTKDAMHTYDEVGVFYAKVTVSDGKGGKGSALLQVAVQPVGDNSEDVGVGGLVPGTLALSITGSANFGLFVPGVTRDYEASLAATATSSATAAELTVRDPSSTATGHLVNGTTPLAQAVQVNATDAANPSSAFAPVPENGSRLRVLTLPAPVSAHPLTIGFKQSIAATESLKTGPYGKTLVFTLSATTP